MKLVHYGSNDSEYIVIIDERQESPADYLREGFTVQGVFELSKESGREVLPTGTRLVADHA